MQVTLPDQFIEGLSSACLQGRAQIVPDPEVLSKDSSSLIFYLDGAHSPESMEICAKWFSCVTRKDEQQPGPLDQLHIGTNSRKVCLAVAVSQWEVSVCVCVCVWLISLFFLSYEHSLFVILADSPVQLHVCKRSSKTASMSSSYMCPEWYSNQIHFPCIVYLFSLSKIITFLLWIVWMLLFLNSDEQSFSQDSSLIMPYLCQINLNTTSLVLMHHHLQSVCKSICHGNYHFKECGKACFIAIKVALNWIAIIIIVHLLPACVFLLKQSKFTGLKMVYKLKNWNGAGLNGSNSSTASSVFESLPLAIKWLRETAQQNQSTSYQVKTSYIPSFLFSQLFVSCRTNFSSNHT